MISRVLEGVEFLWLLSIPGITVMTLTEGKLGKWEEIDDTRYR